MNSVQDRRFWLLQLILCQRRAAAGGQKSHMFQFYVSPWQSGRNTTWVSVMIFDVRVFEVSSPCPVFRVP